MDSQLSVPGQNSKCEVKNNSEDCISRTILAKYFHKYRPAIVMVQITRFNFNAL